LKYKQELTASAKEQLLTGDDLKERAELKEKKKKQSFVSKKKYLSAK
jgi:hypothetical protein